MPSLSSTVRRLEKDHVGRKRKQRAEFLRQVNVADFLERAEVANVSQATSDEMNYSCPFPGHDGGDSTPSAYMNDGTKDKRLCTVWKCHGCGRSGNGITFLAELEHISRAEASRRIKELYAPGFMAPKGGSMTAEFDQRWKEYQSLRHPKPVEIKKLPWPTYHKRFGVDWPSFESGYEDNQDVAYMFSRGFDAKELQEWEIGYDHHSDRITIPVCDPEGNLIGIKGRAWKEGAKPKYMILGDTEKTKRIRGRVYKFKPYDKSLIVFGIHKWGEQDRYVFVEGEIDVMSLWQIGIPALCTGGSSMSETQAKIIRDYANEIVLFLDDDAAGSHGVWGYDNEDGEHKPGIVELLSPFIRVKIVGKHKHDPNWYISRGKSDRVQRLVETAIPHFLASP